MNFLAELVVKVLEMLITTIQWRGIKNNMDRVVTIYDSMKNTISNTEVQRFLVLKLENGGGKIKPNVNLYASVIHEDYESPFESHKQEYQRLLVDKDYLNIISTIINQGYADIFTEKLEEESMIKKLYTAEGVVYSEWYYLHSTRKAIFFCTIATSNTLDTFDQPKHRALIDLEINKIRNAISGKKYK